MTEARETKRRSTPAMRGAPALLAFLVAGTLVVGAPAAGPPERLPDARPGPILPSAGGVVPGRTTKAELLARWGRASACWTATTDAACAWSVGRPQVLDYVDARFLRGGPVYRLQFDTPSWAKSRLRGWRTPEGIGIGSTYRQLERAYPKLGWNLGEKDNPDRSNWRVAPYTFGGQQYSLRFLVDRAVRRVASGHVIRIELMWYGPPLECKLVASAAPGPQGEASGMRIQGSCSGETYIRLVDRSLGGSIGRLDLSFEGTGGARISSAASSTCTASGGSYGRFGALCKSNAAGWPVDVTVGFESSPGPVVINVRNPNAALPTRNLRLTLQ